MAHHLYKQHPPAYTEEYYAVAHAAIALSGGQAALSGHAAAAAAYGGGAGAGLIPVNAAPNSIMMDQPGSDGGVYFSFSHGTGMCDCPACELAQRYAVVYSKQFPAMTPESAQTVRVESAVSDNRANTNCQMWETFGFCFHGLTCMFPHRRFAVTDNNNSKVPASAVAPPDSNSEFFAMQRQQHQNSSGGSSNGNNNSSATASGAAAAAASSSSKLTGGFTLPHRNPSQHTVKELCAEISAMVEEHSNGVFRCRVCTYDEEFDASCIIKVGEMFSYMTCPRCTSPLYQPLMLLLVEACLRETGGQDHLAYKDLIDRLRAEVVPHMVRIPLLFEAHRLASTYFAWSLFGPTEAQTALTAAITETPLLDATCLISMGSGTGYIEHVFAEALKNMLLNHNSSNNNTSSKLSKDVLQSFSVLAFDEILRTSRFSVPVQYGTPDAINCLPDPTKSILLLSWPPFGTPGGPQATMGHDVLKRYVELGGQCVIYIGDVASTGDYDFHCLLQQTFRPVPSYRTRHDVRRWVPQEMGLVFAGNDTVGVYKRRQEGDNFMYFAH